MLYFIETTTESKEEFMRNQTNSDKGDEIKMGGAIRDPELESAVYKAITEYCRDADISDLLMNMRLVKPSTVRKKEYGDVVGLKLPRGMKRNTRLCYPKTPGDWFWCYVNDEMVYRYLEDGDKEVLWMTMGYELSRIRLTLLYAEKTGRTCDAELFHTGVDGFIMQNWVEYKAEYMAMYFAWEKIKDKEALAETVHKVTEEKLPAVLERIRAEAKKGSAQAFAETMHMIALLHACREAYPFELDRDVIGTMLEHYGWARVLYVMFGKYTRMSEILEHLDEIKELMNNAYPAYYTSGSD